MKINEVTGRKSIYDKDAVRYGQIRRLGQQITNSLEPSSGVKWPDDEVWNKASMLGTMLAELPDGQAKTPQEALQKAGVNKEELEDIMAKAKQARAVTLPDPESEDEPEDEPYDTDDEDEIARQADMRARSRR